MLDVKKEIDRSFLYCEDDAQMPWILFFILSDTFSLVRRIKSVSKTDEVY